MDFLEKGKKPDTPKAIDGLKQLQKEFGAAAEENQRKAETLGAAVKVLEDSQKRDDQEARTLAVVISWSSLVRLPIPTN